MTVTTPATIVLTLAVLAYVAAAVRDTRAADAPATGPATQPAAAAPRINLTSKPWTRWWWPGNAVDKENLTRQLEAIAAAGFGGVEITPIYGIQGADDREIEFLSPKYMEMLQHAAAEAKRLGMQLDMATGTGWPFGGPTVKGDDADLALARDGTGIGSKPTRMRVKRAAPGGAGMVLNPFAADAMDRYLDWFAAPFSKFPRDLVRSQFHDSFEYSGNWHPSLLERFKKDRGYDLRDKSAELFGEGDPAEVAKVKADYRQTLNDLHLEYVRAWVNWSHRNGWLARNQAHGAPANLLDLYAASDIPETETFGSSQFAIPGYRRDQRDIGKDAPQPLMARFASSAAHVEGKPLVACETFTWLREHFRSSLSMMKPEVDQMFLCGINHVVYHGTCYSPQDAQWPGWQFYASVEFAPQLTVWRDLPALNGYIERVQAVLQSGKPDNDVLLYFPIHDEWHDARGTDVRFTMHRTDRLLESQFGKIAQDLIARGYSVDFISDAQLADARRDGDVIVTRGGGRYKALIAPPAKHTPEATAKKLAELSAGIDSVEAAKVRPEPIAQKKVGFIRRRLDDGHAYFLSNLSGSALDEKVKLAVTAEAVDLIDPLTGATRVARAKVEPDGVLLQLAPGESLIVRTYDKGAGDATIARRAPGEPVALSGQWEVAFVEGGPELPAAIKLDALKSWTEAGGDEAKRFAGTARYRLTFDAPKTDGAAGDWLLDLGDVRESARVTLNGQPVGTLWSIPFRAAVGKHLKPGEKNVLEVEVTNLAANRVRDLDRRGVKWRIMKEINFVNIGYKPFDASNWDLAPSGLLGPVTLTPVKSAP